MAQEMQKREEATKIPQGVSYTETCIAFYIYFRQGDVIHSHRIAKEDIEWQTE